MQLKEYKNKIILEFSPSDWAEKIPQQILSLLKNLNRSIERTRNSYMINQSDRYLVEKFLPKMWFTDEEWYEGERALKKFMSQFDVSIL